MKVRFTSCERLLMFACFSEGAFVQGQGWCTLEESLWLKNGAIFTAGPGNYKIPGFADIPQKMHVSLLKDVEWPNLGSIRSSKGIGVSESGGSLILQ